MIKLEGSIIIRRPIEEICAFVQPKGFAGLAEPLIASSLKPDALANLGKLMDLLESWPVAVSP
jgi:hypothetical protein